MISAILRSSQRTVVIVGVYMPNIITLGAAVGSTDGSFVGVVGIACIDVYNGMIATRYEMMIIIIDGIILIR